MKTPEVHCQVLVHTGYREEGDHHQNVDTVGHHIPELLQHFVAVAEKMVVLLVVMI